MKITNIIISILFLVTTSCACRPTPSETVDQFYRYMSTGSFNKAYKLISKIDQEHKSLDEFKGPDELSNKIKRRFWALVNWQIETTEITAESASISIIINMPNLGSRMGEIIASTLLDTKDFGNEYHNINTMENDILKDLEMDKLKLIKVRKKVNLLFENGKWRLFFNWAQENATRNAIIRAINLEKNNKTKEAIAELNKVLAVDKDNCFAKEYIILLEKKSK